MTVGTIVTRVLNQVMFEHTVKSLKDTLLI